jgi:hypothetical protein
MTNVKSYWGRSSLLLLATAIMTFSLTEKAQSETTTRSCSYDLIAESSQIAPQRLYELKSTATFSHSYLQSNPNRVARGLARDAALGCLEASKNSAVPPVECTLPRITIGSARIEFNHRNMAEELRNKMCATARAYNRTAIRDYQLRVVTRGGTDVRRECNNDRVLIRGTNLNCTAGGTSASAPETRWSRWYTDKSPEQMHPWIAGYCRNNRNSQHSSINAWEINPNTGALRVHFSCR